MSRKAPKIKCAGALECIDGSAPRGWHHEAPKRNNNGNPAQLIVRNGYRAVQCDGEAHSNPHIDNCGVCAPMWGWIAVKDEAAK